MEPPPNRWNGSMTDQERERVKAAITAYRRLRATPVVDDDFPEMMERFDLEMGRLERMVAP